MTDDDVVDARRELARASDLGRRRAGNGDAERNQRRSWVEELEPAWVREIYLRLWPL